MILLVCIQVCAMVSLFLLLLKTSPSMSTTASLTIFCQLFFKLAYQSLEKGLAEKTRLSGDQPLVRALYH